MRDKVVIKDEKRLEEIKKKTQEYGLDNLHIVADFDRTLTQAFNNGKSIPSVISILHDEDYLSPEYTKFSRQLYAKYHDMEYDPNIPHDEKVHAMENWWREHFELLLRSGLNKKHLEDVVNSGKIKFREGVEELLDYTHAHHIPFIIISASGLGETIAMSLQKIGRLYENIHIVCNSFQWDKNGNAVAVNKPHIHSLNKHEVVMKDRKFFGEIEQRKSIILMGDIPADVDMIKGMTYHNLIKVGFLNDQVEKLLEEYQKYFNVIITDDGSVEYINKLLQKIFP